MPIALLDAQPHRCIPPNAVQRPSCARFHLATFSTTSESVYRVDFSPKPRRLRGPKKNFVLFPNVRRRGAADPSKSIVSAADNQLISVSVASVLSSRGVKKQTSRQNRRAPAGRRHGTSKVVIADAGGHQARSELRACRAVGAAQSSTPLHERERIVTKQIEASANLATRQRSHAPGRRLGHR
jgi:hypothetical protein